MEKIVFFDAKRFEFDMKKLLLDPIPFTQACVLFKLT